MTGEMLLWTEVIVLGVAISLIYYATIGWITRRWPWTRKTLDPFKDSLFGCVCLIFVGAILAVIAIPDFKKSNASPSTREAKPNLRAIYSLQLTYHSGHGVYAGGPNTFSLLQWKPDNDTKYAYSCGADFITNTMGDSIPRSAIPAQVGSSTTGFTCAAVGNIDDDPALDVWTIDDAKNLLNVFNDH